MNGYWIILEAPIYDSIFSCIQTDRTKDLSIHDFDRKMAIPILLNHFHSQNHRADNKSSHRLQFKKHADAVFVVAERHSRE